MQDDAKLLSEIREAMKNREFKAYYQPQYDAITYKLKVAEALVRWIKPDGTIVYPGNFIPILEKTGAICDLDWYMVEEVCDMLKRQRAEQLEQTRQMISLCREMGLPKNTIDEIVETVYKEGDAC